MLTPAKIKNHHFEAAGRNAYKADSVDRFIEEIVESYERMFRENGEMCKKIGLLAEKLEEYRNDEDNIRNALLTAQRMSEQIQREAREKAEQILTEVAAREQAENARIEAQTTELMTKAAYQARTLVEEAQKQAEQIVYDATHESKEAAITARDCMIKEEAALEMMKIEVTKFKKQILDAYSAQLALIEQIPEIACAMVEEEKVQQEAAVAAPVVEEVAEEPVAEVIEEPVAPVVEEIPEPVVEEPLEADAPVYEEISSGIDDTVDEEPIAVDTLQQMIADAEDTDAEDEVVIEDDDDEEEEFFDDGAEVVMPEIDEESEADLDEIVSFFNSGSEEDTSDDIPVSKKAGFKFKQAEVEEYDDDDTDYIDELDDDDDDDDDDDEGEDLASKFRNFFKK